MAEGHGTGTPTGWLKCNGAAFSSEKYPNLAKAYPCLLYTS
ncbi:tail fiber protein, partial [Escherichia coli]|nr:tail fiber protein [Escherichia coli]